MLDNPEKTARLLAALKAAVPFKVELVPSLIRSNSEMSSQIIPLKDRADLRESSRILATESYSRLSCGVG
jgi:hypothetical protein